MTSLPAPAPNTPPVYDETMGGFATLGNNFRNARNLQRRIAVSFITLTQVESYKLEELIEDSKRAMRWGKLSSDERNRANVFFTALRTIDGAWARELTQEQRDTFLSGKLVYSTLVTAIKAARKEADEADGGEGEGDAPAADADATPPVPEVSAPSIIAQMQAVALYLDEHSDARKLDDETARAIANLVDAVDTFRAANAKVAKAA